jgi:hypothetical protein
MNIRSLYDVEHMTKHHWVSKGNEESFSLISGVVPI